MAIHALSPQEFGWFSSARVVLNGVTQKAVEWFADDGGVVLGAIKYHQSDLDWSYVVFRRDIYGTFRTVDLDTGLCDLDDARRVLIEKMTIAVASRQTRSPGPHRPHKARKQ